MTIAIAGLVIASIAALGAIANWWMTRKHLRILREQLQIERQRRETLSEIVTKRKPLVKNLETIIESIGDSYRVIIPIANVSESSIAIAHKVRVVITFRPDNPIKDIDPGPLRILNGGKEHYSVTLEASALPPLYSLLHPSIIVGKYDVPDIKLSWAEQTGYEAIPLIQSQKEL